MKTIIYHAITTYHMLEFIVHNVYNKNENAIMLMPQSLINYYPNYRYLEDNFLMNKVVIMPDIVRGKDEEDVVRKIEAFVEDNLPELFNEEVEVHLAGAQFMFSAYLISKNIPFIFYEEASGILSRTKKLEDNVKAGNSLMYEIASKNGMFDGSNELVIHRICNKAAQLDSFDFRDDDEDFDIVSTLEKLEECEIKKIIHFYTEKDEYDVNEKSCLLLTQHFANLLTLTFEQQVLLYQFFCDFFLQGYTLVIKPHPFDFVNYESILEKCTVIRDRFPSELLPFMFRERPEKVATISSTSIFGIRDIFMESLEMDFDFEKNHFKMIKYFTTELIISCLLEKGYIVNLVGVNSAYYKIRYQDNNRVFLYENMEVITEYNSNCAYVFDVKLADKDIGNLYVNNINCIFLDVNNQKDFFRYQYRDVWNQFSMVNISKRKLRDKNVFVDLQDEKIYVFGKIKGEFMVNEEKELNNTGVVLKMNKYDFDDYEQMALEGKLDATEKRLAYYIKKYEELENRVKNLKDKGFPIM